MAKGRSLGGAKNHHAKLTPGQAAEVRRLSAEGVKRRDLADQFKVTYRVIRLIVIGESYREEATINRELETV